MTAENRKSSNTEWLIEKLRAAERERDEVYVEDMFIPDDEFADIDIPEAEGECRMPSV